MPGEFAGGQFDVTKLEAIEIETATGVESPSNIIDYGENFYLQATFEGKGTAWPNLTGGTYVAKFYAEGMGPSVPDQDFGTVKGPMTGKSKYTVKSPVNNITTEGLYRCGVTVSFRKADGTPFYGVLGYNEDCVIQIGIAEEIE